jgi:hypothetical protein
MVRKPARRGQRKAIFRTRPFAAQPSPDPATPRHGHDQAGVITTLLASSTVHLPPRLAALLLSRGIQVESVSSDLPADLKRLGLFPATTAAVVTTPAEAESARKAGSVAVGIGSDEVALRDACARVVVPDTDALIAQIDAVLDRLSPTTFVLIASA